MNRTSDDLLHYERRLAEEREAARQAGHPAAAYAHEVMAQAYLAMIHELRLRGALP